MGPSLFKAPWEDWLVKDLKEEQANVAPFSSWNPMPYMCPNHNSVLEVHKHGMFCLKCEYALTEAYDPDW